MAPRGERQRVTTGHHPIPSRPLRLGLRGDHGLGAEGRPAGGVARGARLLELGSRTRERRGDAFVLAADPVEQLDVVEQSENDVVPSANPITSGESDS